jgi:hypothetical protein
MKKDESEMKDKLRPETEKSAALMTEGYLKERAKRGSRTTYEAILAKVPDVEPEVYDR